MATEEDLQTQLAQDRAQAKPEKTETKPEETGGTFVSILRRLVPFLVPSLAEILSGGFLPGNVGFVVWTYIQEKKSGKSPNIAGYLIVAIPAVAVDCIAFLGLTGVFLLLTYPLNVFCAGALFVWRLFKFGLKGPTPKKLKPKKA